MTEAWTVRPIGVLNTPWRTREQCPRNGRQLDPAPLCHARVFAELAPGLEHLDGFTHLIVLYWLHQVAAPKLTLIPPFDTRQRGVFATRSPARPNPIGLAVVRFEGMEAPHRLRLRFLDCVDGTPLLDIKPYLPTTDAEPGAAMGWLAPYATRGRPDGRGTSGTQGKAEGR